MTGCAAADEQVGDEARPRRDVEDVPAVGGDARGEEAPPARVLAEGEHRADTVVGRSERLEQRERVTGGAGSPSLYPGTVELARDLGRIAVAAEAHASGDTVVAVLAAEPAAGRRRYLCAFESAAGDRTWLVLDGSGSPVTDRRDVHDAASIAALCELAEECAFPGDLDELRAQLVALRLAEQPAGIDEAEEAARALQHELGAPPTLATPARLDGIGAPSAVSSASLDPAAPSPFAAAMQPAQATVAKLVEDVERAYRLPLDGAAR